MKYIYVRGPGRRMYRVPLVRDVHPAAIPPENPTRSEMLGAMIASKTPAQIWGLEYNAAVKRSKLMQPAPTSKWAEQQADKMEAEIDDLIEP